MPDFPNKVSCASAPVRIPHPRRDPLTGQKMLLNWAMGELAGVGKINFTPV